MADEAGSQADGDTNGSSSKITSSFAKFLVAIIARP